MNKLRVIAIALGIVSVICLIVAWQMFKYKECKKVGHSTFYCMAMINSK